MEFKHVNLKEPSKKFKKNKLLDDVEVIARVTFEARDVDDETLMFLTQLSESGRSVKVTIEVA